MRLSSRCFRKLSGYSFVLVAIGGFVGEDHEEMERIGAEDGMTLDAYWFCASTIGWLRSIVGNEPGIGRRS